MIHIVNGAKIIGLHIKCCTHDEKECKELMKVSVLMKSLLWWFLCVVNAVM